MKTAKLTLVVIGIVGILLGLLPNAWAAGGPAPGDDCCVVVNPSGGALALKGTMALVYDIGNNHNADITLRLERSGTQRFFRLNIQTTLRGLNDESIACLILNPNETSDTTMIASVTTFVNEILSAFFVGLDTSTTRLVITRDSISDTQGVFECIDDESEPVYCVIPGTNRTSSLGDITIYAVDRDQAKLENPYCP